MAIGLLPGTAWAAELDETQYDAVFYVNAEATVSGDGKADSPYKTLAAAVTAAPANKKTLIYVMSDITLTTSVRYWEGKDITFTSAPDSLPDSQTAFTISRAETGFIPVSDETRGGYNGAMFEVGNGANLTLTNLVLDDGGYAAYTTNSTEGTTSGTPYFVQVDASRSGNPEGELQPGSTTVDGSEVSNHLIVQDAIIASYDSNSTITLGEGAVLQNYGGMSAVRVTGGATLIMNNGSKITDTSVATRTKGVGGDGPAGAVWAQSGKVIMEKGSEICDMNGRAIYADGSGSNVTVNGTISGITGNSNMWQGTNGTALHLRNYSTGQLNGKISNITAVTSAVYVESHSEFTMTEGSSISNISSGMGIQLFGNLGATLYMDGEITGVNNSAIHLNGGKPENKADILKATIGPNGNVHHNGGNAYGTVTAQTYNGRIDVYGKINSNYSSNRAGITIATNMDATTVYLHDGAEICNNVAYGTSGVAVAKGTVVMEDGALVSGNITTGTERGSGIFIERDGLFIMEGGQIINNASAGTFGGVAFKSEEYYVEEIHPCSILNGGTISGNVMNVTIAGEGSNADQYSATNGTNCDVSIVNGVSANISRYLTISPEMTIGESSIYMQKYDFYLERVDDVKLGNASSASESALTTASTDRGWNNTLLAALWMQSDDAVTLNLSDIGP